MLSLAPHAAFAATMVLPSRYAYDFVCVIALLFFRDQSYYQQGPC